MAQIQYINNVSYLGFKSLKYFLKLAITFGIKEVTENQ